MCRTRTLLSSTLPQRRCLRGARLSSRSRLLRRSGPAVPRSIMLLVIPRRLSEADFLFFLFADGCCVSQASAKAEKESKKRSGEAIENPVVSHFHLENTPPPRHALFHNRKSACGSIYWFLFSLIGADVEFMMPDRLRRRARSQRRREPRRRPGCLSLLAQAAGWGVYTTSSRRPLTYQRMEELRRTRQRWASLSCSLRPVASRCPCKGANPCKTPAKPLHTPQRRCKRCKAAHHCSGEAFSFFLAARASVRLLQFLLTESGFPCLLSRQRRPRMQTTRPCSRRALRATPRARILTMLSGGRGPWLACWGRGDHLCRTHLCACRAPRTPRPRALVWCQST